jgi:hypothetical protein
MENTLYLVEDESGCLVFMSEFRSVAERYIENYGNENYTISEDVMC